MIKGRINTILQTEMDRKDFLKHIGVAAIAVVGLPSVLKVFEEQPPKRVASDYGARSYGGRKTVAG